VATESAARRTHVVRDRAWSLLALAWVASWAPHGAHDALTLLYSEDNQKWMMSIASQLRGQAEPIAVPLGSVNVQYFVRFVLSLATSLGGLGRASTLVADSTLQAQSNAWVFCLSSVLVVTPVALRYAAACFALRGPIWLATPMSVLASLWSFGQAQSVGHYTQYQLTIVVLVTCVVILRIAGDGGRGSSRLLTGIGIATALTIGGSYNPWLPLGLFAIGVLVALNVPPTAWRRLRTPAVAWMLGLACAIIGVVCVRLFGRFARDLDMAGGVSTTHVEVLALAGVVAAFAMTATLPSMSSRWCSRLPTPAHTREGWWREVPRGCAVAAPIVAWVLGASESTVVTVASLGLLGLVGHLPDGLRPLRAALGAVLDLRRSILLALPVATVGWAVLIWVASRYASEVREPRFAAWKSIVALVGQFGWLLILALVAVGWSRRPKMSAMWAVGAALSFFWVSGFQGRVGESYRQEKWWHAPVLAALADDPSARVVCVSGEVGWPDYETYTCNRYLQTLGDHPGLSGTFRYVAWYRSEAIDEARRELVAGPDLPLVVVSPTEISGSWRDFFESLGRSRVRFVDAQET
jgi:hypothetical protein